MTHVQELPARLDGDEDVQTPAAARLDEGLGAEAAEQVRKRYRRLHGVCESPALLRIEVDAQLVRSVDVRTRHGPGVEGHRAEIGRPDQGGGIRGAHLLGRPTGGECDAHMLHEVGN